MKHLACSAFSAFVLAPTCAFVIAVIVFRRQNQADVININRSAAA